MDHPPNFTPDSRVIKMQMWWMKINTNKDDAINNWLRKLENSQENIFDGVYLVKL